MGLPIASPFLPDAVDVPDGRALGIACAADGDLATVMRIPS
jgi:hypothetical protein